MVIEALFTEKCPVTFSTILGLTLGAGWYGSGEDTSFVTFVCEIIGVTRFTHIHFAHCPRDANDYIVVILIT
jgi:hypothetical protein